MDSRLESMLQHWGDAPLLPSVPLVRILMTTIPTAITVESNGRPHLPDDWWKNYSCTPPILAGFEGDVILNFYREIRLCIGPTSSLNELGVLFESRPYSTIYWSERQSDYEISPFAFMDRFAEPYGYILVDGLWRQIRFKTPHEIVNLTAEWPFDPLNSVEFNTEPWYLSWTPATPGYVDHWLNRTDGTVAFSGSGTRPEPLEQWYAHPSSAAIIERELVSGAIEIALTESAKRAHSALETRRREWRRGATRDFDALLAIWRDPPDSKD